MPETYLDLESALEIGKAYNSLGNAVQEQLATLVEKGEEAEHLNSNAVRMIETRFMPSLPAEAYSALAQLVDDWRKVWA